MGLFDPVQLVSLAGAVLILSAYLGNQAGTLKARSRSYNLMNLAGGAILTYVAVVQAQYGFILLEGLWAAISALALMRSAQRPPA